MEHRVISDFEFRILLIREFVNRINTAHRLLLTAQFTVYRLVLTTDYFFSDTSILTCSSGVIKRDYKNATRGSSPWKEEAGQLGLCCATR